MSRPTLIVFSLLLLTLACAREDDAAADASGLDTVRDSTRADSVLVRVTGAVPAERLRSVVEELRIQPEADDTTLFGETFEFEVGQDGRLFVYDSPSSRLFLFGADGALMRTIGRKGAGPGEFAQNNGMQLLPDGRLVLLDAQNARLNFLDADGAFLSSWVIPAGFSTSNGVRADRSGTVFLVRPVTPAREGEILGRMGLVRLADGGRFADSSVAPDLPVERITYLATQKVGTSSSTSATGPRHAARFLWAWHPDGYYLAVNSAKYEIEVSRPGTPLRIVRDAPQVTVPEEERAWDQERITFNLRMTDPSWTFTGPAIPATKPPIRELQIARDGRIWVRVSTESERIPDEEVEPPREGRSKPPIFRDPVHYEVFATDGTFLGRVVLPITSTWMEADGDRVWVLDRDADGLPGVVRLRVNPGWE